MNFPYLKKVGTVNNNRLLDADKITEVSKFENQMKCDTVVGVWIIIIP